MTSVVLGGDITTASNVLADAAGMSFDVLANKSYLIEFAIIFQSAATTTGIRLAVSGPAAPVAVAGSWFIPTSLTANYAVNYRAYNTGNASTGIDAINADALARGTCIFRNGVNDGVFTLRFASEVNASQVTIRAGSVLRYRQLD